MRSEDVGVFLGRQGAHLKRLLARAGGNSRRVLVRLETPLPGQVRACKERDDKGSHAFPF